jgi:two-component system, chemotaxis family, sensor kinase CheA
MSQMDPAVQIYVEEARELLTELEEALLELESKPDDMEGVSRCFRAMHTIKGGGAMFGFEEISRFTHDVETVFDRVRNHEIPATKDLLTLTLAARDHILFLLAIPPDEIGEAVIAQSDALIQKFRKYLPNAASPVEPSKETAARPAPEGDASDAAFAVFWIRFHPQADILLTGNKPLQLLEELASLGNMEAIFRSQDITGLNDADQDPTILRGWWDILLNAPVDENILRDVFIFVDEEGVLSVTPLRQGKFRGADLKDLAGVFGQVDPSDTVAVKTALDTNLGKKFDQIVKAKSKAQAAAPAPKAHLQAQQTIRVDSNRLDVLVNMVGELVIIQSRLRQAVKGNNPGVIAQVDEDLERLTDEMRDNALGLRMMPIGAVYSSFLRLVRDLSNTLGKQVDFITEGAETELDKTVIDRLKDPLIHIIRNSLDHGVESPEVRLAAGKPAQGLVKLSATHSSGNVVITITDDGKGIDPEAVKLKAIAQGLISPDADLSEKETYALLLEPGFSTAEKVSDVSGRGVGMDVVKRSIDALRGTLEITSEKGKGTTLVVKLPLTLAIIDGFNVLIGDESYIVPLSALKGFQERFLRGEVKMVETIERMGDMIPCISLRQLFEVPGKQPSYERVVITEVEGETVGMTVDQVIGRQQAVIKSMDDLYKDLKWISGTTINGDGSISLILDIPQLVRYAASRTEKRR